MTQKRSENYWLGVWRQYCTSRIGMLSFSVVVLFACVGLYAPFLASSKPIVVQYQGDWYFPLFRYLFYSGFFTKRLDIFYNVLMFVFPVGLAGCWLLPRRRGWMIGLLLIVQFTLFGFLAFRTPQDPASDPTLNIRRQEIIQKRLRGSAEDPLLTPLPQPITWAFTLDTMTRYARLNLVMRSYLREKQNSRLGKYFSKYEEEERKEWLIGEVRSRRMKLLGEGVPRDKLPDIEELKRQILAETTPEEIQDRIVMPTLWHVEQSLERREIVRHKEVMESLEERYQRSVRELPGFEKMYRDAKRRGDVVALVSAKQALSQVKRVIAQYRKAVADLAYVQERRVWLEEEKQKLGLVVMPLVRSFHWEDDAGGEQDINQFVDWWELTRINRKDLVAGLIFGVRISLVVGITAIALALIIGIPVGSFAGYYGGKIDIIVMRLIEIWESMPSFFMLLMVVAVAQSKSIFLVIAVIGIFGWTGFSRFIRGEFLKQRNLPYVEACQAMGFRDGRIVFAHILPNAIPPLLTLLPFAVMGAITSEAGLSFLGLGEEGSCSWGLLMDEGRTAFPGESYLLWPPAIMLTILLVAIALVGDSLRDALDPKMHKER